MAEITIRISDRTLKVASVLVIAVFAAWLVPRMWASGIFWPKYHLRMYVGDLAGLKPNALVRYDGAIKIGSVASIQPVPIPANSDRRWELVLRVAKRYQNLILDNSRATLLTDGLLGDLYVNITPGSAGGTPLRDQAEIATIPQRVWSFDDMMNSASKFADCVKAATSREKN